MRTRSERAYLEGWSNVAGFVFWAQGSIWHRAAQESIVAGIVASASKRLPDPFAEGQRDAALSALGLV